VWHFRTIIAAPPAPTLNTPVDAASNQRADTLLLMWNSAVRATSYRLQVATDTAFGVPFANDPAAVSPYRLTGLATNTTYYWRVNASNIGGTGPWSTRWYFVTRPGVMDVPVLVSPAQGATGVATPVGLVWRATASALNYKVQISTNPGFSANVDSLSGITDTFVTPASISYNTLYYWRACAVFSGGQGNWSASRSFTTGPGAADVPRLVSPDSASCGADLYPTLTWRRPAGALAYTFQLSRNAGFTDLVVNETGIAPTDTVYGATPLLDSNQSYYWRVNATTAGGTTAWSSAWSFATLSSAPDVPLLVAPAHQATDVALNTALRWGTAARAAGYLLQVSAAAGFSPLVVSDSSLVDTVRVAAGLSNGTKYYWRVKAVNCSAQSLWSAVREFTTIVALPGQVALAAPTDADTLGSDSCLAVWQSASPAVTRYSLEYATDVSMTSPITDTTITDTTRVLRGLSDNTVYWWRVRARNAAGWGPFSQTRSFRVLIPLRATTPQAFDMRVAGATGSADAIRYALPQRVHVSLLIYDLLGKMALRAVEREQAAGYYRASLAGLPVGRYVVRFRAGEYAVQRMVALVR
jgi:hypothetical protein